MDTEIVRPQIGNFLDSLREIGYSTEVAVADLIDNSITASSSEIYIYTVPKPKPVFALLDNGIGMDEAKLIEAMRLASTNPNSTRAKHDLGRFGLGLKTSSFSQCKKLTVISKKGKSINCRQWDLSFIAKKNDWLLITPRNYIDYPLYQQLEKSSSGTLIIWEDIDKISPNQYSEMIEKLRKHLSLVFHKFLEGSVQGRKLKISINDNYLKPFNPFNLNHPATQQIAIEKINIHNSTVVIQPYILPHHSKISREEYELYATEEGYLKSQGFYLYRVDRIIIYGTWWGLHKAMDMHKLIRIKVEIPNNMDNHWGIDIKKSIARPANEIKADLKRIINQMVEKGARPYSSRGKKIEDKTVIKFWEIVPLKDHFFFSINKQHPLYINLLASLGTIEKQKLDFFLKGIEAYLPLDAIQAKLQGDPHIIKQESSLSEEDIEIITQLLKTTDINGDYIQELLKTEIFKHRKEIL